MPLASLIDFFIIVIFVFVVSALVLLLTTRSSSSGLTEDDPEPAELEQSPEFLARYSMLLTEKTTLF